MLKFLFVALLFVAVFGKKPKLEEDKRSEGPPDEARMKCELLGESGSIKISTVGKGFIKIKQEKLEEIDEAGTTVPNSMVNLHAEKDIEWDVFTEETGEVTAEFTRALPDNGENASLTVTVYYDPNGTVRTLDMSVPCNTLDPAPANCEDECYNSSGCFAMTRRFCPPETERCSQPIEVPAESLEFTVKVSDYDLPATSRLRYAVSVVNPQGMKGKGEKKTKTGRKGEMIDEIEIEGGKITAPQEAKDNGRTTKMHMDVDRKGAREVISLVIENVDKSAAATADIRRRRSFFFDPTLSLTDANDDSASSHTQPNLAFVGAAVVALVSFFR